MVFQFIAAAANDFPEADEAAFFGYMGVACALVFASKKNLKKK